jgi:hypothetical protein
MGNRHETLHVFTKRCSIFVPELWNFISKKCKNNVPSSFKWLLVFLHLLHRKHFSIMPDRDLDCMEDVLMKFHQSTKTNTEFNSDLAPHAISGLRGKNSRSDQRSATRFSRSGWSVVRSASLAKGGTSIKRPSPHLHKVRLGVIK